MMAFGCSQPKEPSLKEAMNDPTKRKELYGIILENQKHTQKMMQQMLERDSYCQMASRHSVIARVVCLSPALDSLLKHDAAVAASVSSAFIKKMQMDTSTCKAMCTEMRKIPFFDKLLRNSESKSKNK